MPVLITHDSRNFRETEYGFEWGAATIERIASGDFGVVMVVKTQRDQLEIRVTPTGLIRASKVTKRIVSNA